MLSSGQRRPLWLGLCLLLLLSSSLASQVLAQQPAAPAAQPGTVSGAVVDSTGAAVVHGARITLTQDGASPRTAVTDDTGRFQFDAVSPGPFHLAIEAPGFAAQNSDATLHPGESYEARSIRLAPAASISVNVTMTSGEIAAAQVKEQEHQRTLLIFPNFYTSYVPHPAPMPTRLKYHLAWRASFDPVNFALLGLAAGIQQANNDFSGYGQGAAGYGKRFGANTANFVSATFLGGAVFPHIFKQDPRYIYKGTGSTKSRIWYAITRVVICPGDNGRSQFNYSNVLGTFASGGLSNLYYPAANRGAALTFENAGISLGGGAIAALVQEFGITHLIVRHKKKQ